MSSPRREVELSGAFSGHSGGLLSEGRPEKSGLSPAGAVLTINGVGPVNSHLSLASWRVWRWVLAGKSLPRCWSF